MLLGSCDPFCARRQNKRALLMRHQRSNRGLGLGLDRSKDELSTLMKGKVSLDQNDVAAVRAMMIRASLNSLLRVAHLRPSI